MRQAITKLQTNQNILSPVPRLGFIFPSNDLRQRDILKRRKFRQQVVKLVNEADKITTQPCAFRIRKFMRRLT